MATEIELKFLVAPRDIEVVWAAVPGDGEVTKLLAATYYDTPDRFLGARRISLRLRNGVQTLKAGEGLARDEQDREAPFEGLDLKAPELKAILTGKQRRSLEPAFHIAVSRRLRVVSHAGARIEMALDQGEIVAQAHRAPICELELELLEGPPGALFDLARKLGAAAPLYLCLDSKAARGQALSLGTLDEPWKGPPLNLRPEAREAVAQIAREALRQILGCAVALRSQDSAEVLHQFRIATRRFRGTLACIKSLGDDPKRAWLLQEIKAFSQACDRARDLDVFARDNARSGLSDPALDRVVVAACVAAHDAARDALATLRFRDLALDAAEWIELGAWRTAGDHTSLRKFARHRLKRRWRHLREEATDLHQVSEHDLHQIRLMAKGLRYDAEAFAPVLESPEVFIARLKALQDALGDLNDAAVAAELVASLKLSPTGRAAAARLIQDRQVRHDTDLGRARKALKQLAKIAPG